jgi:hypothetical protein
VKRNFTAAGVDRLWLTDITEHPTHEHYSPGFTVSIFPITMSVLGVDQMQLHCVTSFRLVSVQVGAA